MEYRAALFRYLAARLPGFDAEDAVEVQRFSGGQSNPTFSLATLAARYVLRKKPPGKLLPSAHAIEREHAVMQALEGRVPVPKTYLLCEDESTIVHGGYRTDNVLYAPGQPRIAAVLDWELATIGHPLADLAFLCLTYHFSAHDRRGFRGHPPAELNIPSETELVEHYCRKSERGDLPDWRYFLVFALFRSAAIRAGVYKRAFDGTAVASDALAAGRSYREAAATAAQLIRERPR